MIAVALALLATIYGPPVDATWGQRRGEARWRCPCPRERVGAAAWRDERIVASRTLPCGLVLRVRLPRTRREVVAVVADRGPWGRQPTGEAGELRRYRADLDLGAWTAALLGVEIDRRGRVRGPGIERVTIEPVRVAGDS